MKVLIQRVSEAKVEIAGQCVGEIGPGLLALVGIEAEDDPAVAQRMLDKLLGYRVFADASGRMNLSLAQTQGGLLLVSQFTLVADTQKGMRPSFSKGAPPKQAQAIYDHLLQYAQQQHPSVASGRFAADMQVSLVNDGPVTFLLSSH